MENALESTGTWPVFLVEPMPGDTGAGADRPLIVSIDGNIASGKSTLLALLAQRHPDWLVAPEPVDEWADVLKEFYRDPGKQAFVTQGVVLASQYKQWLRMKRSGAPVVVVERTPRTGIQVFIQNLVDQGMICADDQRALKRYAAGFWWDPDAWVYLNVGPAECHRRMQERDRPAERTDVPPDYLVGLHEKHGEMIGRLRNDPQYTVCDLDAHQAPEQLVGTVEQFVRGLLVKRAN
jgi:deoxyadenosine/deoxycytidine kinase